MKGAFFESEGWEAQYLAGKLPDVDFAFYPDRLDKDHIPQATDFETVSVFVGSSIDEAVVNSFPNLRLITTRSTGYDHIDLEACKRRNVAVAYVPGYGDNTVAEWAFGLILNLTRRMYWAIDVLKEGGAFDPRPFRGVDLKGKTIGVVGTGRIGREVIKIARGFSMDVVAFDAFPNEQYAQELGFRYAPLEEVLKVADIVTLHVPYMESTHHLINKGNIMKMKRGSYLVNTSRGPVVETEALLEALHEKILAGAGLDVLEEEGMIKDELNILVHGHPEEHNLKVVLADHILEKLPNVILTPHNAFNTIEALQRILDQTIGNIQGFLQRQPRNIIGST